MDNKEFHLTHSNSELDLLISNQVCSICGSSKVWQFFEPLKCTASRVSYGQLNLKHLMHLKVILNLHTSASDFLDKILHF